MDPIQIVYSGFLVISHYLNNFWDKIIKSKMADGRHLKKSLWARYLMKRWLNRIQIWCGGSLGMFLPHPRVKVSIVGSLRDREVACSASDRQGSNFESCVWRTVSSQSSHHPQEVLLAQFSLYVHKSGLKPDSFHFSGYFGWSDELLGTIYWKQDGWRRTFWKK